MPKEPDLVTIADLPDPSQTELAKSRLESAGIEYFLVGEESSFLYGGALGGVQLQVRPEDVEDAKAALDLQAEVDAAEQAEASEETSHLPNN